MTMRGSGTTMESKANIKNGMIRLVFTAVAVLLEVVLMLGMFLTGLGRYAEVIAVVSRILALLLVLGICSQNKTASIKMTWITLILAIPAFGVFLYILIGLSGSTAKMRKRFEKMDAILMPHLVQDAEIKDELWETVPSCFGISRYILEESGYPLYRNEGVVYYSEASEALEAQKQAMRQAESFIFMEYFAVEDAESWMEIQDILADKVKQGVEVRVFYDDIGSSVFVNKDFARKLEGLGIRCRIFNPMIPVFNLFLNNRDHRKMTIIDGKIGFTGGYNIANEYFNVTSPYGHWKDAGVRLTGDVVRAMTVAYLEMWNAVRSDDSDDNHFAFYLSDNPVNNTKKGFVQFYTDNPVDKKPVGEDVYLSLISQAKKYLYIMTPYLIITDEMSRMIGLAAKRGVDVRIITPGIPDKKIIYKLTRSYYARLVFDGVRIYEYTPGFCHAKLCVTDDIAATCGTINMDYRSLYHHFEDGCLMIGCDTVAAIKSDFDQTLPVCREVTDQYRSGRSAVLRFGQLVLRLLAPLM